MTCRPRYAASPPAGVPYSAQQFAARVLGGYQYVSDDNPHIWDADGNNWQPRVGATYKLGDKNVIRGGVGLFVAPFQIQGVPGLNNAIQQFGFARDTPVPVTSDQGVTFQANLSNPVPSGQLLEPIGSSLGLRTNLGGSPGTIFSVDRDNPQYWRYSFGFERELPWQMVMEICTSARRDRICRSSRQSTTCLWSSASQSPVRDGAGRDVPERERRQSVPGTVSGQPGCQRRQPSRAVVCSSRPRSSIP